MSFFEGFFFILCFDTKYMFIFGIHYSLQSYCISRVAVSANALQKDIVALQLTSWCRGAQPL